MGTQCSENGDFVISIHFIGGRDGKTPLENIEKFKNDILWIIYDADEDCIQQINEQTAYHPCKIVAPYGVGRSQERSELFINHDPYTSSVLPTKPDLREWYFFMDGSDYVYGQAAKCQETRSIQMHSLDLLADNPPQGWRSPDVLFIDVQGNEKAILEGASKVLKNGLVAIELEARFEEIYGGETLFPGLAALLRSHGFDLAGLANTDFSPYRGAVGLRARGFPLEVNALFYRNPETLAGENAQLAKLAFMALTSQHMELAVRCLELIDDGFLSSGAGDSSIIGFLHDLSVAIASVASFKPWDWNVTMPYEASKARFQSSMNEEQMIERRCQSMQDYIDAGKFDLEALIKLGGQMPTDVEKVLADNGFKQLSENIMITRLEIVTDLLKLYRGVEGGAG